jgi:hypothetical protein
LWSESWLRHQLAVLRHAVLGPEAEHAERLGHHTYATTAIIRISQQPEMRRALQGRRDPGEAVRDLATRYAFEALMIHGRPLQELDRLSQALIQGTLADMHHRAEKIELRLGENPLDADDQLLVKICESLARYVPCKPMGGHIAFKLGRPESAASRAMRQIQHLVQDPRVCDHFVAHVLQADLSARVRQRLEAIDEDDHAADRFKARLALLARGGGLQDLDWEATIRFFAQPETVAFVKGFAGTVQPARTLYAEEEYCEIAWQGKRQLPARRRQGYLERALAQVERPHQRSLDVREHDDGPSGDGTGSPGWYETLAAAPDRYDLDGHTGQSFEAWVVETALDHAPDDPVWQAGGLIIARGLAAEAVLAQNLADHTTVMALQQRLAELRATPEVWAAWQEACGSEPH